MSQRNLLMIAPLCLATAGCYDGDLDASLDQVYVCEADTDCALGSSCVDNVCSLTSETLEPTLQIVDPSPLDVFALGQASNLPIVIAGTNVALTSQASDAGNAGYIEVLVDGAVIETVTDGVLEEGIAIDSVAMPTTPGLHHITLVARTVDGEVFASDRATTSTGFWVDDGAEHVGILRPAPAAKIPIGDGGNLLVEVVSLNFTLANPGFVAPEEVEQPGLGYVNLYLDREMPGCLPECNFEHQNAIAPAGLSRVNRLVAEQGVLLPDEIGTVRVQIVAQMLSHIPYTRSADDEAFVFHTVHVQSTVEVPQ